MSTRQQAELAITDETRQEGSRAMTIQTNIRELIGSIEKMKALAAGLLVAGMMATSLLVSQPAHAATTFTVNDTRDSPDASTASSTCDIDVFTVGDQCTLRAAIQQANAIPGADTINFNIPGTGVKTIAVGAGGAQSFGALPPITEQVTIDGYTQPGASPNTLATGDNAALKIELNGASLSAFSSGLEIGSSSGTVIKGLVIHRFAKGIQISGDSVANHIEGNFIGTDPTGTLARGNGFHGLFIVNGPSENVVGGDTPAARNLISGNGDQGVLVDNSDANRFQGNYVGTDKSGTKDLGNTISGIHFNTGCLNNLVGGTTAGARNLISGNGSTGVGIAGSGNKVLGNRIGTTVSGTGALGNGSDGVSVSGTNNVVGDGTSEATNTIAFNGGDGVAVGGNGTTSNRILKNSVFSNTGLGIDLAGGFEDAAGRTANDPGDIDSGANGLQNFPVLASAKTVSGKTTVTGKLASTPSKTFKVQFYSNPSGNEGKKFIVQKSVTTDGSGNASFTISPATTVSVGQTITATATDPGNNTSEFSAERNVASS